MSDVAAVNSALFEKLAGDEAMQRQAVDAINRYTRMRMREPGFYRVMIDGPTPNMICNTLRRRELEACQLVARSMGRHAWKEMNRRHRRQRNEANPDRQLWEGMAVVNALLSQIQQAGERNDQQHQEP